MLTEQQKHLLIMLPETEYGQALYGWLRQEIKALEDKEETVGKICNDPLIEDFRVQMGIKIGLKRVLNKPQKLIIETQRQGDYQK